ncbi:hypothetical protein [Streptomyces sp. ODS05-4]|uniref:hypothetical protein n=1 Tax=Streptomyces sp. ODS05-4 TaxID=2944939 RepID=UPI00210D4B15|nr:hypothetical protein [Streptomyces sp. ODS05-4]
MTAQMPEPGDIRTRAQLHAVFGGSTQGGIIPSGTTPNVLLFVDHAVAATYGYSDGWLAEEDERGRVFEYTGAGQEGDQTFAGLRGAGNRATLQHRADRRVLRLFVACGTKPDSAAKLHRYVGEFFLDEDQPYVVRQALDKHKAWRRVVVFRLRPAKAERMQQDQAPVARKTTTALVPADVTASALTAPEHNSKRPIQRKPLPKTSVQRREASLSEAFEAFLRERGREAWRYQIKIKGTTSTLLTDLYDPIGRVLYEIKGAATRHAVRMAIGQLLDYRRHIEPRPRAAVLLPERPQEDLCDLLAEQGIALAYRGADGEFHGTFPGPCAVPFHGENAATNISKMTNTSKLTSRNGTAHVQTTAPAEREPSSAQ